MKLLFVLPRPGGIYGARGLINQNQKARAENHRNCIRQLFRAAPRRCVCGHYRTMIFDWGGLLLLLMLPLASSFLRQFQKLLPQPLLKIHPRNVVPHHRAFAERCCYLNALFSYSQTMLYVHIL